MKLISHRGNINGRSFESENHPEYIDKALLMEYDCEIDIWYLNNTFYLGHDTSQYLITLDWLKKRLDNIWIHCKNIQALGFFNNCSYNFNYFWHQEDSYTLTSHNKIWTYPNKKLYPNSICVMPERGIMGNIEECFGICSDYIKNYKK